MPEQTPNTTTPNGSQNHIKFRLRALDPQGQYPHPVQITLKAGDTRTMNKWSDSLNSLLLLRASEEQYEVYTVNKLSKAVELISAVCQTVHTYGDTRVPKTITTRDGKTMTFDLPLSQILDAQPMENLISSLLEFHMLDVAGHSEYGNRHFPLDSTIFGYLNNALYHAYKQATATAQLLGEANEEVDPDQDKDLDDFSKDELFELLQSYLPTTMPDTPLSAQLMQEFATTREMFDAIIQFERDVANKQDVTLEGTDLIQAVFINSQHNSITVDERHLNVYRHILKRISMQQLEQTRLRTHAYYSSELRTNFPEQMNYLRDFKHQTPTKFINDMVRDELEISERDDSNSSQLLFREALQRRLQETLSDMTILGHELRAPLTVIKLSQQIANSALTKKIQIDAGLRTTPDTAERNILLGKQAKADESLGKSFALQRDNWSVFIQKCNECLRDMIDGEITQQVTVTSLAEKMRERVYLMTHAYEFFRGIQLDIDIDDSTIPQESILAPIKTLEELLRNACDNIKDQHEGKTNQPQLHITFGIVDQFGVPWTDQNQGTRYLSIKYWDNQGGFDPRMAENVVSADGLGKGIGSFHGYTGKEANKKSTGTGLSTLAARLRNRKGMLVVRNYKLTDTNIRNMDLTAKHPPHIPPNLPIIDLTKPLHAPYGFGACLEARLPLVVKKEVK